MPMIDESAKKPAASQSPKLPAPPPRPEFAFTPPDPKPQAPFVSPKRPQSVFNSTEQLPFPASPLPDRVWDLEHPTEPNPLANSAFSKAWPGISAELETKDPAIEKLPAVKDEFGRDMVRIGGGDTEALNELKNRKPEQWTSYSNEPTIGPTRHTVEPSSVLDRAFVSRPLPTYDPNMTPEERATAMKEWTIPTKEGESIDDRVSALGILAAEVINDGNSRLANLRKDYALSPGEEAEYRYTTPTKNPETGKRNTFTEDQLVPYWNMGDGVYTDEDRLKAEPIGMAPLDPNDPDLEAKLYGWGDDGKPYTATAFKMKPGTPEENIISFDDYKAAKLAFQAFPDGTVWMRGDGSQPESAKQVLKDQTNKQWLFGTAEPRLPWQDRAGNTPIFDKEWRLQNMSLDPRDSLSSSADLLLGSLPYFVPGYRYASAASQSLPYLLGYDPSTQEPTGRLFENLDKVGTGRYLDSDLTYAQRIAGATQPWIDAWAETASGKAIGGLENVLGKVFGDKFTKSAAGKFLKKNPWGKALSGAGMETIEEIPSVIPGAIARDSLKNLGREQRWDDSTGKVEYSGPWGANLAQEHVESGLAGGVMGGTIGGVQNAGGIYNQLKNLGGIKKKMSYRKPVVAPRMTDEEIIRTDPRFHQTPEE